MQLLARNAENQIFYLLSKSLAKTVEINQCALVGTAKFSKTILQILAKIELKNFRKCFLMILCDKRKNHNICSTGVLQNFQYYVTPAKLVPYWHILRNFQKTLVWSPQR